MINKKLFTIVTGVFAFTFLISILSDSLNNLPNEKTSEMNPRIGVESNPQYVGFAESLASMIKNTPDLTTPVDDAAKATQIMSLYNHLESVVNTNFGTNLPQINFNENTMENVMKFTPLLGPATDLRQASLDFDKNNPKSIDNFYLKLASFLGDTVLFSSGGIDLIQKESSTAVITALKDSKIEEKIVNMCKTDCTKQFKDNTNYFVSYASGQVFPAFTQIHFSIESFKQFLKSHFHLDK